MKKIYQKTVQKLDDLQKFDSSIASVIASFAREKCVYCCRRDECSKERKQREMHNVERDYCDDFDLDALSCRMRAFAPKPETPLLTAEKIKEIISGASDANRLRAHSQKCGCYHCMTIFRSDEIDPENLYISTDRSVCSVCEYCGIDSVICEDDLAGIALLTKETLKQIHDIAFSV